MATSVSRWPVAASCEGRARCSPDYRQRVRSGFSRTPAADCRAPQRARDRFLPRVWTSALAAARSWQASRTRARRPALPLGSYGLREAGSTRRSRRAPPPIRRWARASGRSVRAQLEGLLDFSQAGWRKALVDIRFAPRMVVSHSLPAPGQVFASRPLVTDTSLPRVLIAGDWVGPGGWLLTASLSSALAAAKAIHLGDRATETAQGG